MCIIGFSQSARANPMIDSLEFKLKNAPNDSVKAKLMVDLAWHLKFDSAQVAQKLLEDALILSKELNLPPLIGKTYNQLGVVHSIHGDYIGSINYYIKALEIFEQLKDTSAIAMINNNIGMLFYTEKSFKKAIEHFNKSLAINISHQNWQDVQMNCINMSDSYRNISQYDSAMKYVEYGMEINRQYPNKSHLASFLLNKGLVLDMKGTTKSSLDLYKQAFNLDQELEDKEGMSIDLINIAYAKMSLRNYGEAEKDLELSEKYATEIDFKDHLAEVYLAFIQLHSSQNNYKQAFEYENKYIELHDSLLNANMKDAVQQIEERHKLAKAEAEYLDLKKASELREQQSQLEIEQHKVVNYITFFVLVIVLLVTFFIFRNSIRRKKINTVLEQKNNEIADQKSIIEQKNLDVMDSIEYAKKIQLSILPENQLFDDWFSEYFIFYQPKDIVSGDFYWANEQSGKIYFAVVDCTGHGVPGAFMSIIAFNGMNKILNENLHIRPGQLLDKLHFHVRDLQHMQGEEGGGVKEGMDLAVCSYDPKTKILEFAGALNPLLLIMNDEMIELDANRRSIASTLQDKSDYYRNYVIKLDVGDSFYLFTDGFVDQFGGPKGKKLTKKRFQDTLVENNMNHSKMDDQGQLIKRYFNDWKGKEEQIDDVCVIGIKV